MTFVPDERGIHGYLNQDRDLRECLEQRAHLGLAAAKAAAPQGTRGSRLAASGHVVFDGANSGVNHDRMSYSIVFDDPIAVPVIFGTRDTPDHLAMMRAALAVMGIEGHDPAA
jgi:hypothetical protein